MVTKVTCKLYTLASAYSNTSINTEHGLMNSFSFGPNENEVIQHLEPQESPQHPLNFPAGEFPTHLESLVPLLK